VVVPLLPGARQGRLKGGLVPQPGQPPVLPDLVQVGGLQDETR
jgi:hypothetical protein